MALKFDSEKPDFTQIPQLALGEVAKVATLGAKKYEEFNYSKEESTRRYLAAALRHINQYLIGEDIDEIGTHHLANAAMSVLMSLDNILTGVAKDDRNEAYSIKKVPKVSHVALPIMFGHSASIYLDRNFLCLNQESKDGNIRIKGPAIETDCGKYRYNAYFRNLNVNTPRIGDEF